MIPTGSRGRKRKEEIEPDPDEKMREDLAASLSYYQQRCREAKTRNVLLQEQIRKLEKEKAELLEGLRTLLEEYRQIRCRKGENLMYIGLYTDKLLEEIRLLKKRSKHMM